MLKNHLYPKTLLDAKAGDEGGDTGKAVDKSNYVSPEANKEAIEKARLEERSKLREEQDKQRQAFETATQTLARLQSEKDAAEQALAAVKKNSQGEAVDLKAVLAEVTGRMEKQYADMTATERAKWDKELSSTREKLNQMELRELRARLIQEAGGADKLVLALVRGNSEEELKSSVVQAKEAYEEVAKGFRKEATEDDAEKQKAAEGNAKGSSHKAPPKVNTGGEGGTGKEEAGNLLKRVKEMTPEEYKTHRTAVRADLQRRYGR